jgi:hypothetical protein
VFEDGYYVSFFWDDSEKVLAPRSIVVIKGGVVGISANPVPENDADLKFLKGVAESLRSLTPRSQRYEEAAVRALGPYWSFNGYSPNPSDYIEPDSYDGRYDDLINLWRV